MLYPVKALKFYRYIQICQHSSDRPKSL